jgi:hypothetical protein
MGNGELSMGVAYWEIKYIAFSSNTKPTPYSPLTTHDSRLTIPYLCTEILATLQVAPLITEHSWKGMSKMNIYGIIAQPRV